MGGEGVFEHARESLGRVRVLEPWPDVDTAADLDFLAAELEKDPLRAPAVAGWLHRAWEEEAG
jgi:hypothetical protein